MKKYARKDTNQDSIVDIWRLLPGASVFSIHTVGGGVPDLVLGANGYTLLVEVKNPEYRRNTTEKNLSKDELLFAKSWQGNYIVAWSYLDLLPWYFHVMALEPGPHQW